MKEVAAFFKAMSDVNRLRVLSALMDHSEMCACQIVELLDVTGATVSRHMDVLVRSGLVNSRRDGRWVHYSLVKGGVSAPLMSWLEKQLGGTREARGDKKVLAVIMSMDRETLCGKQKIGENCR